MEHLLDTGSAKWLPTRFPMEGWEHPGRLFGLAFCSTECFQVPGTGHRLWLYRNSICEITQGPKRNSGGQTLLLAMHSGQAVEVCALQKANPLLGLPATRNNWTLLNSSAAQLLWGTKLSGTHPSLQGSWDSQSLYLGCSSPACPPPAQHQHLHGIPQNAQKLRKMIPAVSLPSSRNISTYLSYHF